LGSKRYNNFDYLFGFSDSPIDIYNPDIFLIFRRLKSKFENYD
jgi:hypothetical protein